jgi:mono/diheme cytochrome c family protein
MDHTQSIGFAGRSSRCQPGLASGRLLSSVGALSGWLGVVLVWGFAAGASAGWESGEIAFAEMNCLACHQTTPAIAQRLASRKSPAVGQEGSVLSPTWVRDFLLNPQQEKPGNLMPDSLHGLTGPAKREAAEALTHYLVSLQVGKPTVATRFDPAVMKRGGELYHKVGCVACHAPQELPVVSAVDFSGDTPTAPDQTGLVALATNSIPLGNLPKKYSVAALANLLRDPLKARPSGRMPNQRLSEIEAQAIAMYLLREQPVKVPPTKIPGLNYEHFVGLDKHLPDFSKLAVVSTGYATNLSLINVPRTNTVGLRFRGVLSVPQAGEYTFWTESRDGSQLFINNQMVVDNDGVHKPTEKEGKITLAGGDHSIVVTYFHHVGPPVLKVSWAGPGFERQEISGSGILLADNGKFLQYADEQPFTFDPTKAVRGQQLFEQYNCASCHQVNQPGRPAAPLGQLAGNAKGCLSPTPPTSAPAFAFTPEQRKELGQFLSNLRVLEQPLSAAEEVHRTMTALNCYACHSRAGAGELTGLRRAYFKVNGTADLGEEGAIPPHLNGVGAKLKPAWLEKVLLNGASVRPYMATRMPQFGTANVKSLGTALLRADAGANRAHDLAVDSNHVNGLRLVGNEGLSCIACHTFAGHPSLGIPALDLSTAPERLNADWFRRYLLAPAKLRPGTRMPSFWPEGVAANKTILDGDPEKQISAIWSYLASDKATTELPPGLIAPKMELTPKSEPLIYRNFIKDAGSRAIGVGYPEKVNLAFDANQMGLALLWHGQFMDPSRHWVGRGNGWQPPLGYSVVKFSSGVPFAAIKDEKTLWPKTAERAVGYQFRGYDYDAARRPKFLYRLGAVEVTDFFLPVKIGAKAEAGFRRTLTLRDSKPAENLWFRAAVADKVTDLGNDTYLVDDKMRIVLSPSGKGPSHRVAAVRKIQVRSSEGKFELLVPVIFKSGQAEITEEFSW